MELHIVKSALLSEVQDSSSSNVAICIAGGVRTLVFPAVYESIEWHLMATGGGVQHRPKLFLYLNERDGSSHPNVAASIQAAESSRRDRLLMREAMRPALRRLQPTRIEYQNRTTSSHSELRCTWAGDEVGSTSLSAVFEAEHACMRMIRQHEHRTGTPFTHIIRTRPDAMWLGPVPPPCEWPSGGARYRDWAFLLPRDVATKALEAPYETFLRWCATRPAQPPPTPPTDEVEESQATRTCFAPPIRWRPDGYTLNGSKCIHRVAMESTRNTMFSAMGGLEALVYRPRPTRSNPLLQSLDFELDLRQLTNYRWPESDVFFPIRLVTTKNRSFRSDRDADFYLMGGEGGRCGRKAGEVHAYRHTWPK
eukprot:CAMPEP_0115836376 /NCGR_PEP_ID=MMETSP0287-20121206/4675_1 /TAXON_ID=412157 /ORGANISM="Chrysochromulina rotalis, Strain UIO044" /LENGTH=365 /DNA_ID=CAMNT_0003289857 /DNA_START=128 /DNA_END=1226 /DNA_ORIENTATION=+